MNADFSDLTSWNNSKFVKCGKTIRNLTFALIFIILFVVIVYNVIVLRMIFSDFCISIFGITGWLMDWNVGNRGFDSPGIQ